jgi:lichenan operon transcriptional antiterminator
MHNISLVYDIPFDQEEIKQLAVNLQGKREYDQTESISKEINDFVFESLSVIKNKFGPDFLADLNFRIGLALHTKPLISRLQSHIQISNNMTFGIKQKYSYAFDLASEYSFQLTKKYNVRLSDDEIAYLALHFIVGLQKIEKLNANKKILIISEQRKRNTVLIQQQILQWFREEICSIDLASSTELGRINLNEFDAILTTNEKALELVPHAVQINFFPTQTDHIKIEMALSGITNSKDILQNFHPELFYAGGLHTKNETIELLCDKAEKLYPSNGKLLKSVMLHEMIANTYFGNDIAMPHPDIPVCEKSFICVAIPKKPIFWENNQTVELVLLVSIEKDNPAALQIWQYLSYFISDEDLLQQIIQNPTYSNFIEVVTKFYQNLLGR